MAKMSGIYKCEICGNIVEVVHSGAGTLVCCNKPMKNFEENSVDAAVEKHVPVIERIGDNSVAVKVGSVEHPMLPEHHIEWIEVFTEDKIYRKYLNPDGKPEAVFSIDDEITYARAYCNLHGLWKK